MYIGERFNDLPFFKVRVTNAPIYRTTSVEILAGREHLGRNTLSLHLTHDQADELEAHLRAARKARQQLKTRKSAATS